MTPYVMGSTYQDGAELGNPLKNSMSALRSVEIEVAKRQVVQKW